MLTRTFVLLDLQKTIEETNESPNGCDGCDYCFCLIPEDNDQFQQCATYFELRFLGCVEKCEHIEE